MPSFLPPRPHDGGVQLLAVPDTTWLEGCEGISLLT